MSEIRQVATDPDPYAPYRISQAIRFGELVLVSGQAAIDANGLVGVGDFDAQAEQAFRNLRDVLEAAGSGLEPDPEGDDLSHGHVELPEDRRPAWSVVLGAVPGRLDPRGRIVGAPRARDRDRGDRGSALARERGHQRGAPIVADAARRVSLARGVLDEQDRAGWELANLAVRHLDRERPSKPDDEERVRRVVRHRAR